MNRIQELRAEKGWRQADLAVRLSISRQAVANYEEEKRGINSELICRLCDIFGVTADYLLGRSAERTPEMTEAEYTLLEAYRAADLRTRQLVDLQLEPYTKKETSAAG